MLITRFNFPTTILYGPGAVDDFAIELAKAKQHSRLLIVTDKGLVRIGLADRVKSALAKQQLEAVVFDGVHPNPIEDDVEGGAALFKSENCDGIIGLGGGSPVDAAKAIAMLASHEGPYTRYDALKGGHELLVNPFPGLYAIATTAGTGSEVGRSCVVIGRESNRKIIGFHPGLLPRIAVLDPEFTVGLPPGLTAATGMDAFTHALEAYLSKGFNPMCDGIALSAMELIVDNLPTAVRAGDDLEARGRMLVASTMAATAFQKGLGVVHSLAHPMSTHYGAHHGLANALLLEPVFAWQLENCSLDDDLRQRYQRVVRIFPEFEEGKYSDLPQAIAGFLKKLWIETTLPELGLKRQDLDSITDEAFDDPCHTENPIDMSKDDLRAIYSRILDNA